MKWTRWHKFGEIFEYHGPVRHTGVSSPKSFKYKDLLGPLHTDDGFRLRSMERFSQREFPLKISLNKLKCPLFDGEIGCYWIRIHKPKAFKYLRKAKNVLLTPHVAGWTVESKEKLAQTIVDKVKERFS